MESKSVSKYLRSSSSKARLVANLIKGESYYDAVDILKTASQKAAGLILKTLQSAGANAKYKNPDLLENNLYIKKITIDEGPTLKRFMPRARGRASRIRKRTSNITIILSDEE